MIRAHKNESKWTVYPDRSKDGRRRHIKLIIDGIMYILDEAEAMALADKLVDVVESKPT